jgi:hypothetical protein
MLIAMIGCGDDSVDRPGVDNSDEYFPLTVGHYVEYQVDSIVLDDAPGGNTKDTISFQLKEEITSYQLSVQGDTIYYIHRFRRDVPEQDWILKDVWTTNNDENNILRTEENLTFRKMNMPLYKGLKWIATSYISPNTIVLVGTENMELYDYWESEVLDIDGAEIIGGFNFPTGQVMHVRQTDTDDDLMKRYVHETYVRDIGLAARRDTMFDSRCIDLGDFTPCLDKEWTEHAKKGYILSQVMIGHN